jgi:uncharacterized protein YcbK (DUF882 family)
LKPVPIKKLKLKPGFVLLLKAIIILLLVISTGFLLFSRENRSMIFSFFSKSCKNYRQVVFSNKLDDKIVEYSSQARQGGIKECKTEEEVKKRVADGELFKINSGSQYIIDKMTFSYPYLTGKSKSLLEEIGSRFKEKAEQSGLKGSKFIVTSMTRTTDKMKGLRRNNRNASDNSPHLNGNAFDITYIRFSCRKLFVTPCDKRYLKEALAEVLWQLREENKCWATFERGQGCFHVVSR